MSSAGTLISDLDSITPVGKDEDLVQKILADMNTSGQNPVMGSGNMPPAPSGRVISSPNPNTTYPQAVDPATATAHMIGKEYPTPADFASMVNNGYAPSQQHMYGGGAPYHPQQHPIIVMPPPSKGNLYADILNQIRQPILVALIVFALSLPVINVMIGLYMPTLLRAGGDMTTSGLLLKSVMGGALFWFINKVLVPLVAV